MKFLFLLSILFLLSCQSTDVGKGIRYYTTVHRLQRLEGLGKFSFKLKLNEDRDISIARFASISNKNIKKANIFKWEKGYGLEFLLEESSYNNWLQEIGRDTHRRLIIIVDGEYFTNAYYDRQNFVNPVRLYCPLPKELAKKIADAVTKNYQIMQKRKQN